MSPTSGADMQDKAFYDARYRGSYRDELSTYEVARWAALAHAIPRAMRGRHVERVLDYGCGSGLHVPLWHRIFAEKQLHFCDLSTVGLEKLAAKYPEHASRVHAVTDNVAAVESESVDVVVSVEVMEHVLDLDAYLRDIHRVLRPGGSFIWTTPCANSLSIEHIYAVATRQIDPTDNGSRRWRWEDPGHVRRLKSSEIAASLAAVGFAQVTFRYRAHLFSFLGDRLFFRGRLRRVARLRGLSERLMRLDYDLFRRLPNGASMIGFATKAAGPVTP